MEAENVFYDIVTIRYGKEINKYEVESGKDKWVAYVQFIIFLQKIPLL